MSILRCLWHLAGDLRQSRQHNAAGARAMAELAKQYRADVEAFEEFDAYLRGQDA